MTTSQMKAHGMSVNQTWATPKPIFEILDKEFHFTLDPCCGPDTAKVKSKFYTEKDDGLSKDWSKDVVFMNPPYGDALPVWVKKAYEESCKGATVVCLIPARFDPKYWHDYCLSHGLIAVPEGRIYFELNGQRIKGSPPFPAAFVVFSPSGKEKSSIAKLTRFGKAYYNLMKKRMQILSAVKE